MVMAINRGNFVNLKFLGLIISRIIRDILWGGASEIVSDGQYGSLPRKDWKRKEKRPL